MRKPNSRKFIRNLDYAISNYGSQTPESLSEVLEGSETVSVDLNEEGDKMQVRLDQDVIDEISGKLDASKESVSEVGGLVVPSAAPAEHKLVGIDTGNGQELIGIGAGLKIENGVLMIDQDT